MEILRTDPEIVALKSELSSLSNRQFQIWPLGMDVNAVLEDFQGELLDINEKIHAIESKLLKLGGWWSG